MGEYNRNRAKIRKLYLVEQKQNARKKDQKPKGTIPFEQASTRTIPMRRRPNRPSKHLNRGTTSKTTKGYFRQPQTEVKATHKTHTNTLKMTSQFDIK